MTEEQRLKRNAYAREWYAMNREKCTESARRSIANRSDNQREQRRQYARDWRDSRSMEYNEKRKKYMREHMKSKRTTIEGAEKLAQAERAWREKNPDKLKIQYKERWKNITPEQRAKKNELDRLRRMRRTPEQKAEDKAVHLQWRRDHPDRHNANNHRRRSIKKGNGGSYTADEWLEIKQRWGYRCLACNRCEPDIKLTVDHVIPITKGGRNDIANIQPLCYSCNASKQNRTIDYREQQLRHRRGQHDAI